MSGLEQGLKGWFGNVRGRLAAMPPGAAVAHIGTVTSVGDGVATVTGLPDTRAEEVLEFATGARGIALRVREGEASVVLLDPSGGIAAGTAVRGTGELIRVPVGEVLLGRVVDAIGRPLDGGPAIAATRRDPVERAAPGIAEREAVTEPLMTGLVVVDAMIPLGRGQRELIIGDRKTGKTTIALDTILNQKTSDVICVYCAIGQKASTVSQAVAAMRARGAFDRCIVVVGEADAPPGAQWIAPYAACTMAEYFRDRGRHALVVYDDLTKHAVTYRELSLLLRRPPGREAFPGDVFYLHSRLLERAARLSAERGGGSLTALPIAETQGGNLTAYIPTNLISITDGQIYLEPKLFYEGQKPAVNVGLSVSRVGSQTQSPAMKAAAGTLKLDYGQFVELEAFTRFGAMMDPRTQARIDHGRRIRAILVQPQFHPASLAMQVALLSATAAGRLDALPLEDVARLKAALGPAIAQTCPEAEARIAATGKASAEDLAALAAAVDGLLAGG
ncbi:F0F1 ATP synthase subunit alpha [Acidimangrovimonas sediminis]|uniref:F0F1 ATP synthase subunit alpha n=1 Tax=Acidimangrovimonas sediminis TaxID=2056283 RepID=UPI000C7F9677|nr:F0F1 ATP synthase subunit alpha [Acidimangrovimonas sediminis]